MNKAIFFDRDGVVNERIKGGYVRSWEEFIFSNNIGEVLAEVKAKSYLAVIITNQRGVGIGRMTEADLLKIHQRMQESLLEKNGVKFDLIVYCTDPNDDSRRRKPSPAMLLEAADELGIDLKNSWMVGDSASDIAAGFAAGTKTAYLITKHSEQIPKATVALNALSELLQFI